GGQEVQAAAGRADREAHGRGVGAALQRPREVVRDQGILRLAGDEEVQDPRAGEAGEVPELRAVPAVPWVAVEGRGDECEVSRADGWGSVRDGCEDGKAVLGVSAAGSFGGGDRGASSTRDRESVGVFG